MPLAAGDLNRLIRVERPIPDDSLDGAGSGTWASVAEVWAQVQDVLPSRAERLGDGISISERPSRVRMRFRRDISPEMRFVIEGRAMQIVSGPAELGFREGIEFMVVEYRPAGNPA